ncbi:MAG TPA: ribbon-helix-helix domain-containing protein [Blastocatellia bacterium]
MRTRGNSTRTGYFPPEVKKQLRLLAAERETTIQRLLAEALNGLFAANGKPELAPLEDA